ncbi:MAG: dephospho-CoA kinase [Bdellovibrionales bacterium]|jgi:dephospho-CoA kinase
MKKKRFLIIGLTGGIGMGKSTALKMFAALGVAVFDADACVRAALAKGGAAEEKIKTVFPASFVRGRIHRPTLFTLAFHNKKTLAQLEAVLHPLVWKARDAAIAVARKQKSDGIVLDIPLLFETGAQSACDKTLCLYTSAAVQKERVLKRKNMTPAKLKVIQARQKPIAEKRLLADVSLDMGVSRKQAQAMIAALWALWKKEQA